MPPATPGRRQRVQRLRLVLRQVGVHGRAVRDNAFAALLGRPRAGHHEQPRRTGNAGPVSVRHKVVPAETGEPTAASATSAVRQHGHAVRPAVPVRHHHADRPGDGQQSIGVGDSVKQREATLARGLNNARTAPGRSTSNGCGTRDPILMTTPTSSSATITTSSSTTSAARIVQ